MYPAPFFPYGVPAAQPVYASSSYIQPMPLAQPMPFAQPVPVAQPMPVAMHAPVALGLHPSASYVLPGPTTVTAAAATTTTTTPSTTSTSTAPGAKPAGKPGAKPAAAAAAAAAGAGKTGTMNAEQLEAAVKEQGEAVRALKSGGGDKAAVEAAVAKLLDLKQQLSALTGKPVESGGRPKKEKKKKGGADKGAEKEAASAAAASSKKEVNLIGIDTPKSEDFSKWYQQVVVRAELIDYYSVSGCFILRPWSYAVWDAIKEFLDAKIKKSGVSNCYFPLFVPERALMTEKDHVEGFAPEVAWVTRSGQSEMQEPIAIRPTSETVMYPVFAKWIQSHRDLPLRVNQWANVVRWEFSEATPFIRSREFLWQEGHTAFATYEESAAEVLEILDYYSRVYSELLAVPTVKGRKSKKEQFAGGHYTTTVEAFVPENGRAIQAATSHCLGQNFAKMFHIEFEGESAERQLVWQNSWGLSTRSIGAMIMIHGDDKGLVMPPRASPVQVVIVPIYFKDRSTGPPAEELGKVLGEAGIRVKVDSREDKNPGWKYNHWELKGVPIRVELGPRDLTKKQVVVVRRDTGEKTAMPQEGLADALAKLLDTIHDDMLARATKRRDEAISHPTKWSEFVPELDQKKMLLVPWCGEVACEENIKKTSGEESKAAGDSALTSGAKSLCIPLEQPKEMAECTACIAAGIGCKKYAVAYTLFGRSY